MPDPTTTQTNTVQPGIVDTDILMIRPPFALPVQIPLTAEAAAFAEHMRVTEEIVRRANETVDLALRTAAREHAENRDLHRRLARRRSGYWVRRAAVKRPRGGWRP